MIDLPLSHAFLPLVGFLVGFFGSFAGLGGGFILVPTLARIFGVPYATAVACTLAQMVGMALSGLIRHWQLGHVDRKLAVNFLAGSLPGALLGREVLHALTSRYGFAGGLNLFFDLSYGIGVTAAAVAMLVKLVRYLKRRERPTEKLRNPLLERRWSRRLSVFGVGLAAGFFAGLYAIGGGVVAVPVLTVALGVSVPTAVGTSMFQMVPTAIAATLVSLGTEQLEWPVIGLLMLGSVPGGAAGPWLLNRVVRKFRHQEAESRKM